MKRFALKREREREIGGSLEKKTFLEPWINTAVVKSEEHADGRRERRREKRSFLSGRPDNRSAAKCSGQTNSQLKFRLHGEHTCISCGTTKHCAPEACGVWIG